MNTSTQKHRELERRSSAVTLSDMEVFIFPELIYSLVLANIMSPRIWRWKEDPWFAGLEKMKPYRRITRLKQYIMDHYMFNLDLDTWGLTSKEKEMARFRDFIDEDTLAKSNALFGYEGDKYYFDIDIRTHFGLDKYEGNIIPYWKTETVEAMDAFRFKPGYNMGAGECVSLATLYAAALFIVAKIPLKDIFLMATPLHSQNFVNMDDGILTNNRRLVTKTMWFNGTELSAQARRALENERVTIVAHETGYIHTVYPEATISPEAYARFSDRLRAFLRTPLNRELLGNYLRHSRHIQKCFQVRSSLRGADRYTPAERVFAYEEESSYRITDGTRDKLMAEVEHEDLHPAPLPSRIILNDLEQFVEQNQTDITKAEDIQYLKKQFASSCLNAQIAIESLIKFCRVDPRLPDAATRTFGSGQSPLELDPDMGREGIIRRLEEIRAANSFADMAFYAYRDLIRTESDPFLQAAIQRNPVSATILAETSDEDIRKQLDELPDESIYDDPGRLAQPDEVWNYRRGDGLEKAILLAGVLRRRQPRDAMSLKISTDKVLLQTGVKEYTFRSSKKLPKQTWTIPQYKGEMK